MLVGRVHREAVVHLPPLQAGGHATHTLHITTLCTRLLLPLHESLLSSLTVTRAGALGWRNHNQQRKGRRRGAERVPRFTVLGTYQSLQLKVEHYDVSREGEQQLSHAAPT